MVAYLVLAVVAVVIDVAVVVVATVIVVVCVGAIIAAVVVVAGVAVVLAAVVVVAGIAVVVVVAVIVVVIVLIVIAATGIPTNASFIAYPSAQLSILQMIQIGWQYIRKGAHHVSSSAHTGKHLECQTSRQAQRKNTEASSPTCG